MTSDWTAVLEAQVQHPLMRNRGTMINRIPVVLASLNEDISIAEFEVQVRNLVRDVEVAYWDLYVSYRAVATTMVGRNSAQATQQFAKFNLEAGTGTQQDLSQATEQYFQFKGQLESALAGSNLPGSDRLGVYGTERQLREKMGLAPTDGRLIRPITEPNIARVEFDWDESVAQCLYLSPELRRTKIRIKQLEQEQLLAKNQILPEVDLSLLYRWVGVGDVLGIGNRNGANFPAQGSSALAELRWQLSRSCSAIGHSTGCDWSTSRIDSHPRRTTQLGSRTIVLAGSRATVCQPTERCRCKDTHTLSARANQCSTLGKRLSKKCRLAWLSTKVVALR